MYPTSSRYDALASRNDVADEGEGASTEQVPSSHSSRCRAEQAIPSGGHRPAFGKGRAVPFPSHYLLLESASSELPDRVSSIHRLQPFATWCWPFGHAEPASLRAMPNGTGRPALQWNMQAGTCVFSEGGFSLRHAHVPWICMGTCIPLPRFLTELYALAIRSSRIRSSDVVYPVCCHALCSGRRRPWPSVLMPKIERLYDRPGWRSDPVIITKYLLSMCCSRAGGGWLGWLQKPCWPFYVV